MRVVHVVPHLSEEASGPSQTVLRLCESLADEGLEVGVECLAVGRRPKAVSLVVYRQWRLLGQFGFSLRLAHGLAKAYYASDVVHNHSLWAFPNIAAGLLMRKPGAALVTSPRGTLAPAAMSRSRLKKCLVKPLQWPVLTRAACLHATSTAEHDDIRRIGLRQPVAVIPNGIDIPPLLTAIGPRIPAPIFRLLFLGRLHPIKGIELLLGAWRELQNAHPEWELVIAGKGDRPYEVSLHALAAKLDLRRVSFRGPIYGDAKRDLYQSSQLFVLPTESENFGMTIAEALANCVPVITTHGAPWPGLVTHGCGWWVERNPHDLAAALDQAMRQDPQTLNEMGTRGRDWMIREFDWTYVARRMAAVYRWLRAGGEPPACVHAHS